MKTNRIVVLKDQIGFGIYATVEEYFIGLLQVFGLKVVMQSLLLKNIQEFTLMNKIGILLRK